MKNMFRALSLGLALCMLGVVAGCKSAGDTTTTPQSATYSVKGQFNIGLSFATWYKSLPSCGAGAPPVCSKPDFVDKIKLGANAANKAIQAAEDTVRSPNYDPGSATGLELAATNALSALLQIIVEIEQDNPAVAAAAPKPKT